MLSRKEIKTLLQFYFKFEGERFIPYEYQLDIADAIINKRSRNIDILATTRAGKSLILALSAELYALYNPYAKIRLIAPLDRQAKILMNYIIEHLTDNVFLLQQIPFINNRNAFRLQEQLSKTRITWRNGCEFQVLSAHGDAKRLQGIGGDLIIIDEAPNIDDKTYEMFISRMRLENPESIIVKIGNSTHKNHFWNGWNDADHLTLKIDCWKCVEDGRFTKEEVEYVAKEMGGWDTPAAQSMLLCNFVDDAMNSLFKDEWIENAIEKEIKLEKDWWFELGIDVARYGNDLTVFTTVMRDDTNIVVYAIDVVAKRGNVEVADMAISINREIQNEYKKQFEVIKVDDLGLGGGVTDILDARNMPVVAFRASAAVRSEYYANKKAQTSWNLRKAFSEGRVSIPNDKRLINELRKMTYEFQSDKSIRIKDPADKSPDFYDSLMIAYSGIRMQFGKARMRP